MLSISTIIQQIAELNPIQRRFLTEFFRYYSLLMAAPLG